MIHLESIQNSAWHTGNIHSFNCDHYYYSYYYDKLCFYDTLLLTTILFLLLVLQAIHFTLEDPFAHNRG